MVRVTLWQEVSKTDTKKASLWKPFDTIKLTKS